MHEKHRERAIQAFRGALEASGDNARTIEFRQYLNDVDDCTFFRVIATDDDERIRWVDQWYMNPNGEEVKWPSAIHVRSSMSP